MLYKSLIRSLNLRLVHLGLCEDDGEVVSRCRVGKSLSGYGLVKYLLLYKYLPNALETTSFALALSPVSPDSRAASAICTI